MKARSRNAFTLVELLVVIAMIGIIVAMVSGAVFQAQTDARAVICQAQMKSIGYAIAQLPKQVRLTTSSPVVRESVDDPDDPATKTWAERLIPYVDEEVEVFHCPSDAGRVDLGDRIAEFPSYGINSRHHRMGSGDGDRIVLLDYHETVAQVVGTNPQDMTIGGEPDSDESWRDFIPVERHGNQANVLFYDGRVQTFYFDEIDPLDCETHYRLWQPYEDEMQAGRQCDPETGEDLGS